MADETSGKPKPIVRPANPNLLKGGVRPANPNLVKPAVKPAAAPVAAEPTETPVAVEAVIAEAVAAPVATPVATATAVKPAVRPAATAVKPAVTPAAKPVVAPKPAAPAAAKPAAAAHKEEAPGSGPSAAELAMMQAPVTRREFLNYAFLGSLGIFLVALGGATFFFALPRFGVGEFGGQFILGAVGDNVPPIADAPLSKTSARAWISNTDTGVIALYNVCVHLGCLYAWQPVTNRFECPCHGSKYQKNGTYIEGPAPRSLDRFIIRFTNADGKVLAETNAKGEPLAIPDPNAILVVDTGKIILGKSHG